MSQSINNGVSTYDLTVSAYDTIAALRSQPVADSPNWTRRSLAATFGSAAPFDGVFGFYAWDPTSVAADNGSSVIKPDSIIGPGRWRIMAGSGGGSGGSVDAQGDNFCFTGVAPNQVLQIKNLDTGDANRIDTRLADPDATLQVDDGSPC